MSLSTLFRKGTSQQHLKLDQSEWLVLKELASFFLSVDFSGSQLEALLRARASLPESNTDEITASILTPSSAVLIPSSTSRSEVDADVQTIRPPLLPSPRPTSQPSSVPPNILEADPELVADGNEWLSGSSASTRPIIVDRSFEYSTIDGPVVVDNFSHGKGGIRGSVTTTAFSHSTIRGATVNNHSWNDNVDCFTDSDSRMPGRHVLINNHYRY